MERPTVYFDSYYRSNLDIIKNEGMKHKWDCLAIFFGQEGAGKSTLAIQTAWNRDPTFCLDRVVFTPDEFIKAIDEAEPEQAIVWDEAITGANVMMFASKISNIIISKLTQIRKKRLYIFLCFPYLHMLNKYFVSRALFSCYVYARDFDDRGYFKFYNAKKTQILYAMMKEKYTYFPQTAIHKVTPGFFSHFSGKFPLDEKKYDIKKEKARIENDKDNSNGSDKWRTAFSKLVEYVKRKGINMKEIAIATGMNYSTLRGLSVNPDIVGVVE